MSRFRRTGLVALALTAALLTPMAQAGAVELSGAWATDADMCGRVFTRKDNQVVFAEMSDLFGSGFIIDGNRITGKAAHCTIESRKQDGDAMDISAACASSIMNQNVKFSIKFIDDNTINRSFEDIPGMSIKYYRCKI